jgi:4'-phosphopantetheinyl transferase
MSPLGNQVHVYACDINTLDTQSFCSLLTNEELDKANAFRQQADTRRFITGRLMAKKILGYYAMKVPSDIVIKPQHNGKPLAYTHSGITLPFFNISHSGNKVLIACSHDLVGIDIELVKDIETENLAETVFSERELRLFRTAVDKAPVFYQFWTRKEALLKAAGVGLTNNLPAIDISHGIDVDFSKSFTEKQLDLLTFIMHDREKYFASLCYVKNMPARFIIMTNDLLSQL